MSTGVWEFAAIASLAIATLTLAAYCFLKIRARRDARKRKILRFELPVTVAFGSIFGVLIGELMTGRYPHADLDELKTLMVPLTFGMTSRSLIMYCLKDEQGVHSASKYVPGVSSLLTAIFIAGGTAFLGS
ncbi:hypothetical protein [Streptomyces sp. H27-C3]|uniref:hypothetical protein n=1 Tax=Streptomyces sp. H27-C3 TaxID=3046305 RepID=UPI0024BA89BC|nr:hypothetical protein [Streptomyces sp. H27-C3]MDJ0465324.1 hypothetical protein [Streptomyces sp. H27-C3]